jgi:hypothetical protein
VFPTEWKEALVAPFLKKGDASYQHCKLQASKLSSSCLQGTKKSKAAGKINLKKLKKIMIDEDQ